jgi:hypothetical protein
LAGFTKSLPSFEKGRLPVDLRINSLRHIKSIRYHYFDVKNDTLLGRKLQKSDEYIYRNGKLVTVNEFDQVSDSILRVYEYDSKGRIKRQLYSRKGIIHPGAIYLYDESLKSSIKNILNDDSTILQKRIITYNHQNMAVKTEILDSLGHLASYYTYKYNKNGDLIEQNFINTPNGSGTFLDATFTNGNPRFDPWPDDSEKFEYKYGKHRKPESIIQYHNSKKVKMTQYFSKMDTLIVTESDFWPGEEISTKRKITKTFGNVKIEILEFLTQGNKTDWFKSTYQNKDLYKSEANCKECGKYIYRNEYEFDNSGNWIRKKRYSNDKLISVIERKINYIH